MKTTVKAVSIKDIRDKEQLYIVIENENGKIAINVGKKTYDGVKALTEVQQPTLDNVATGDKVFTGKSPLEGKTITGDKLTK